MEKTKKAANIYSSFMLVKLQPEFRRLISNEKIAAKQEFENMVGAAQEKLFLRTYMVSGLRSDADILIWRMSDDLPYLQEIGARTFSAGAGRYFTPSYCYLGVHPGADPAIPRKDLEFGFLPKDTFGRHRFMLLHPVVKSHTWYELSEDERGKLMAERAQVISRYRDIQENFFLSYGLDEPDMIVAREAKSLEDLTAATHELRLQRIKNYTCDDKPVFLCLGRDLREIMDAIS
ncbi:MAG: chlorite dismutase family protein [Elusimicrobiales bacterium]|nr:chlorite dismutase family protein [Elusimicrobiales bacterium]